MRGTKKDRRPACEGLYREATASSDANQPGHTQQVQTASNTVHVLFVASAQPARCDVTMLRQLPDAPLWIESPGFESNRTMHSPGQSVLSDKVSRVQWPDVQKKSCYITLDTIVW